MKSIRNTLARFARFMTRPIDKENFIENAATAMSCQGPFVVTPRLWK